jgi:hypothetical protein
VPTNDLRLPILGRVPAAEVGDSNEIRVALWPLLLLLRLWERRAASAVMIFGFFCWEE